MSDEEWAFFVPFVIETGPRRGRRPILTDGRACLSNNAAERALRGIAASEQRRCTA